MYGLSLLASNVYIWLGSNLGTTTTSLLASFAAGGHHVKEANQIALVHMLFNLTGILIFYPVPCMRLPVRRVFSLLFSPCYFFSQNKGRMSIAKKILTFGTERKNKNTRKSNILMFGGMMPLFLFIFHIL